MIEVIDDKDEDEIDSIDSLISILQSLKDSTLVMDGEQISRVAETLLTWGIVFAKSVCTEEDVQRFIENTWLDAPECDWSPIGEA